MKNNILLLLILLFAACSPQTTVKMGDYQQLPNKIDMEDWVGKKVTFLASPCTMEYQHMIKTSINGVVQYICIEVKDYGQILGYYDDNVPIEASKNMRYRVFGTIQKMTGAGKGGGTHTEYYIDLENIEL